MFNPQTIDRLTAGIQSIISENRSSFSDQNVELLKECIAFLEAVRDAADPKNPLNNVIIARVIEILLRVLLSDDFHKLKDLLF